MHNLVLRSNDSCHFIDNMSGDLCLIPSEFRIHSCL